ncbi:hypothetical protein AURDEDRAFT_185035 [Auricularia subglabra TFB-10046 SS5]|nr:hypothetical protein AURDEDRAFT_185035 [Auricularia subglabra TFB-10046 SS5]
MELQKDSLVELIVQLKATVHGQPDVARSIMMTHPRLAHAILKTMAELDIVEKDLFQKTVLPYAQSQAAVQPPVGKPSAAAPAPVPAVAPAYPTQPATFLPPAQYTQPAPPPAPTPAPAPALAPMYHGPGPAYPPASHYPPPGPAQIYQPPPPPQAPAPAPVAAAPAAPAINPAILAAMTDEQRQAILHIVQMTPEQLALIPPAERATYIELRRQFGIPS